MATTKNCDICGVECTEDIRTIELPCFMVQKVDSSPPSLTYPYGTMFNGKHVMAGRIRTVGMDACPICHTELVLSFGEMVWNRMSVNQMETPRQKYDREMKEQQVEFNKNRNKIKE